jgi:hypothetical protein
MPAETVDAKAARTLKADGMTPVLACVPTGPERCFDAIDDNCNGIIDEGCGIPTGALQVVLAWYDSSADADLALVTPQGFRVHETMRQKDGFRLDRDCPTEACNGQNVETIVFDGAELPKGIYVIEVKLGSLGAATFPVRGRLGVRVGSRTFGAEVELSLKNDRKTLLFEL